MHYKKIVGSLILSAVITFVVGYLLTDLEKFNICRKEYIYNYGEIGNTNNLPSVGCVDPIRESVGQPLFLGSLATGLIFLILLFLPQETFLAWRKWGAWLIPAGALWIILTPVSCDAPLGLCLDKELTTFYACGAFVVISLLIIVFSTIRHHTTALASRK